MAVGVAAADMEGDAEGLEAALRDTVADGELEDLGEVVMLAEEEVVPLVLARALALTVTEAAPLLDTVTDGEDDGADETVGLSDADAENHDQHHADQTPASGHKGKRHPTGQGGEHHLQV